MKRSVERLPDVCIAGAGLIGLSLALELDRRGARVVVLERDTALAHASTAAAGMLAADDPENPPQLGVLAALSIALYAGFLARVEALSGIGVPFQTARTLQAHPGYTAALDPRIVPELVRGAHHFRVIEEHSIDPRQLAESLRTAVRHTAIDLREHTSVPADAAGNLGGDVADAAGCLVDTRGAWSIAPIAPRKGQMLTVRLPASLGLRDVVRTTEIYVVPRTQGPRAGLAIVGATVEDAGFDTGTREADLARLRALAADLLPQLADEHLCPAIDQWAGLRPATPDLLPMLGAHPFDERQMIAVGHYRNGILLAPATAHVVAQLIAGEVPAVDLAAFAPTRFLQPSLAAQAYRYSAIRS